MSELTYKKIIDVDQIETLNDAAAVFINDNGAIKQVAANEFGTVKTVNGIAPDENGDIKSDIAVPVLITHLKFPTFDDIKCNKTCEELHHSFLTQSTEATSIALCLYTALDKSEEYRYCTNFVLEKANGEFTKRYFLYFGEDIAPYIIDVEANTVTLDPDWVKPEENAQPDWNQNDSNAADYVKNRTHWMEIRQETVVEETTITGANGQFTVINALKTDGKYIVNYNGTEYECMPKTDPSGDLALGNLSIAKSTLENTDEPFLLTGMSSAGAVTYALFADGTGTHVFAAFEVIETVHAINEKYIPSTIARKSDLEGLGEPCKYVFLNSPLGFMAPYSVDELFAYTSDSSAYNKNSFIHRIQNPMNPSEPVQDYHCTNIDITATKMVLYFGDLVAPIIIDKDANTITLDPNWVKPEENIQPDWNQNDPNAPDYVKNRTHWLESNLDVVLPEVTIDKKTAYLNDYALYTRNLQQGHTYHVVCDGAEYQCSPVWNDVLYSYTIGNASLASVGSDTGEPFFINAHNNMQMTIIYFSSEGQHTISIDEGIIDTVHTIDPKYLPEDHINSLIDSNEKVTALTEEIEQLKETGGSGGDSSAYFETVHIPGKNLLNLETMELGYITPAGVVASSNTAYKTSDYITVNAGDILAGSWIPADTQIQTAMKMRYVANYTADKVFISTVDNNADTYTVPENTAYIRVSLYTNTYKTQKLQIEKTENGVFSEYEEYGDKEIVQLKPTVVVPEVVQARNGYDTLNARLNAMTQASFQLNLPSKLYALVGEELNVWFDNLVNGHDTDYVFEVNCSVGMQLERCYRLTAETAGEYDLTIKATDKHGASVSKTTKIIVAATDAGSGDTASLIVLGDSTTNNGIAIGKLVENFANDTMSVSVMGTRGVDINKHEGRSGWTFRKYFESAGDGGDSSVVNPFYNPTTQTFDAAYYFANSGVSVPEWFFINLGINDTFGYYDDETLAASIESLNTYCDQMIASIKAAASAIKIGVCLTIPPNYSQDAFGKAYKCGQTRNRYKRNNVLWVENLIKKYDGRENENIYLVPIHTNLDTKYGMGMEEMPHSKRNTETYLSPYGNGGVHPVESGYWQIADVYWFFLKSFKKKTANSLLDFTARVRTDAVNTVNSSDPHEMNENKCHPCGVTGVRSHSSNVRISEYNAISATEIQLRINSDQTGVGMEFPVPTLEAGKTYTLTCTCDSDNMRVYLLKYNADTTAYDSNELLLFNAGTHTKTIVPDAAYVYSLLFNVQVGDQLSTFSNVTLVEN